MEVVTNTEGSLAEKNYDSEQKIQKSWRKKLLGFLASYVGLFVFVFFFFFLFNFFLVFKFFFVIIIFLRFVCAIGIVCSWWSLPILPERKWI